MTAHTTYLTLFKMLMKRWLTGVQCLNSKIFQTKAESRHLAQTNLLNRILLILPSNLTYLTSKMS